MTSTVTRGTEPPPLIVEEPIDAVVERVRALLSVGPRVLLGITGPPGAGKSTLVEALGVRLGGSAAVVGMDGFHLADAELHRLGRRDRKGAPDTFDAYGYASLLARLQANRDPVVYAPLFDRALEEPIGSAVPIPAHVPLIITEGNYLLLEDDDLSEDDDVSEGEGVGWSAVRPLLDVVWYLDLPEDVRIGRLADRHERYGMAGAAALERATSGSDGRNAAVVARTRDRAELVLAVTS
jgi:pantothenate kinase